MIGRFEVTSVEKGGLDVPCRKIPGDGKGSAEPGDLRLAADSHSLSCTYAISICPILNRMNFFSIHVL